MSSLLYTVSLLCMQNQEESVAANNNNNNKNAEKRKISKIFALQE